MSDIFTRTIFKNSNVSASREIQYISREKHIKIVMNVKQTKDRLIINRCIYLGKSGKVIKKIEIIDVEQ